MCLCSGSGRQWIKHSKGNNCSRWSEVLGLESSVGSCIWDADFFYDFIWWFVLEPVHRLCLGEISPRVSFLFFFFYFCVRVSAMPKCKELVNDVCFFSFCEGSNSSSYMHFFLSCVTSCIFLCFVFISSLFSAFFAIALQQHMTLNRAAAYMAPIARRMIFDNVRFLLF